MRYEADEPLEIIPTERRTPSEVALWRAVLARAIEDATTASDHFIAASESVGGALCYDPQAVRSEARRFCVSMAEPWASDRRMVCDLADVDERRVRRVVKAWLEANREDDAARQRATEERHRRELDNRLEKLAASTQHQNKVDQLLGQLADIEARVA